MSRRILIAFTCWVAATAIPSAEPPRATRQSTALVASHEEAERWAHATLKTLSLEQKVGQMICEQIRGEYIADGSPQLDYWLRLVRQYGVGGFVVYGGTPHDTARLLNRLQRESKLPLLISADFEGGPGQQIAGAAEFPPNMALAAIGSDTLAYQVAKAGALEGRAIGIHLTYSPVVDIQTQPNNPVLSGRSFGSDVERLGRLAAAYIRGYQENGMLATAKHYPGRGDVELIPGTEFTINRKPADQIEREDLRAFKYAIDAGVAFVMSEHIAVPSLTNGSDLPASVDRTLAAEWLRGRLDFKGVLTSDDLWYAKMTDRFGADRVGVLAIRAGHDVLLKPADAVKMIGAVVAAVRSGEIREAQIDDSVRRLLYWKARLNLHRNRLVDESAIDSVVGTAEHIALVRTVAERSLTMLINDGFFPGNHAGANNVVHVILQKQDHDPGAVTVAAKIRDAFPGSRTFVFRQTTGPALYDEALHCASTASVVIVSVFNPRNVYRDNGPLREADLSFIGDIARIRPKGTVVMLYGNPYVSEQVRFASAVVVGYGEGGFFGNQVAYADAFIRLLKGEIGTEGHLPVRVSDAFPAGAGVSVAPASPQTR
jgi:beta-N-acetylhexosaminidase